MKRISRHEWLAREAKAAKLLAVIDLLDPPATADEVAGYGERTWAIMAKLAPVAKAPSDATINVVVAKLRAREIARAS